MVICTIQLQAHLALRLVLAAGSVSSDLVSLHQQMMKSVLIHMHNKITSSTEHSSQREHAKEDVQKYFRISQRDWE